MSEAHRITYGPDDIHRAIVETYLGHQLKQSTLFGAPPRQRCDPNKRHMVKATEAQKPAPKPGWRPAQTLEERRREAKAIQREHELRPGE